MNVKCENVVRCGNYDCMYNGDTYCAKSVIALDADGKCAFSRSKRCVPPSMTKSDNEPAAAFGFNIEDSK